MKKKILHITLFVLFILSIFNVVYAESISEQVQETLELYLNHNEEYSMMNSIQKNKKLIEIGIDPLTFSKQLLSDIQYYEFWYEAVYMYVTSEYKKNPVATIDFLVEFMSKEENIYNLEIIKAKSECLNIILQMVGPNYWQNKELKNKIVSFSKRYFDEGKPLDPDYWFEKYRLMDLKEIPKDKLTEKQSLDIAWVESVASLSVQFAGFLYHAEGDPFYLNLLEQCDNSKFPRIKNKATHILSMSTKSLWLTGKYELFANIKQYTPTQEDVERMKKSNGLKDSMRTTKDKNKQ